MNKSIGNGNKSRESALKLKNFLNIYNCFFTKEYWLDAANEAYLYLFRFFILKRFCFILPVVALIFNFFGLRFGAYNLLNIFAALSLVFYTLKSDCNPLSISFVFPNTFLSIGIFIRGIDYYYRPIYLIIGIFSIVQVVLHWLLLFGVLSKKFGGWFLGISAVELVLSFIYGPSFCLMFLPQFFQLVMCFPVEENLLKALKLDHLRAKYFSKCFAVEEEYRNLYSDKLNENNDVSEQENDESQFEYVDLTASKKCNSDDSFDLIVSQVIDDVLSSKSISSSDKGQNPGVKNKKTDSKYSDNFNMDFLDGEVY